MQQQARGGAMQQRPAMPSTQFADLPAQAVQLIISKARSRRIGGTNAYASVYKTWQQASSEGDQEQLHLLVDERRTSVEQLDNATRWLSQYGQQVVTLDLFYSGVYYGGIFSLGPVLKQLFDAAALREGLTHLVLDVSFTDRYSYESDTLGDLMQLGLQLPNLQHLEASTDLASIWDDKLSLTEGQLAAGDPTPMERLLPALTSLSLQLVPDIGYDEEWDELLPAVLPRTLQQLQLSAAGAHYGANVPLNAVEHLAPFPQLRRLALVCLHLFGGGVPTQVEELHLAHCCVEDGEGTFSPSAAKVLELNTDCTLMQYWVKLGVSTEQLTILRLQGYNDQGWAEALSAPQLPRLQQLALTGTNRLLQPEAEQLSQLSNLRQLTIACWALEGALGALGLVTQLTALDIADLYLPKPHGQQQEIRGTGQDRTGAQQAGGQSQGQAPPEPHTISSMLQQLTGLRQLNLASEVLLERGPWLPCLTQLTLLAVVVRPETDDMAGWWESTSPQLQDWLAARPASLQQLRFGTRTYTALPPPVPELSVMCAPLHMGTCWQPQPSSLVQPCPHLPGVMEVLGE